MTRRQLGAAVLLSLVALCAGRCAWRASHPDPVESAHAAALGELPASTQAPPDPWLASFFPAPAAGADGAACAECHVAEAAALATSAHAGAANCQTCHVREGVVFAATPAPSATPLPEAPHAVTRQPALSSSAFCAPCHDDATPIEGAAGKPLHETFAEWQRTPAAARGDTCQSCHIPAGDHAWRGLNDKTFTTSAFTARAKFISDGARMVGKLTVTAAEGVGHRLPTAAGPEFVLSVDQLDDAGLILEGTHREGVIGRRLDEAGTVELFDTRLLPGEAHELRYEAPLHEDCGVVRARVEVRANAVAAERTLVWEERVVISR